MLRRLLREIKATMGIYEPTGEGQTYGLLAEFPNPGALMQAAEHTREAGYSHFDTYSPFPIHGMNRAMGLGNSKVGWFCLLGAIAGLLTGLWLQWWTSAVDFPLNISGKPYFAWEYAVPIMFELMVLFGSFGAVAGMLALNGLPRPYNPLFFSERFAGRATDDGFFLMIAAADDHFDPDEARDLLTDAGATYTEVLYDRDEADEPDEEKRESGGKRGRTGERERAEVEAT